MKKGLLYLSILALFCYIGCNNSPAPGQEPQDSTTTNIHNKPDITHSATEPDVKFKVFASGWPDKLEGLLNQLATQISGTPWYIDGVIYQQSNGIHSACITLRKR